jgi:hypothetical protein
MRRYLAFLMGVTIALSIGAAAAASPQQPGAAQPLPQSTPARELVLRTFVDVEDVRKNFKSQMELVRDQMKARLAAEQPRDPELLKIMDESFEDMIQNYPFDEILEAMIRFAQQHFTAADLEAIAAFRATPEGKSITIKTKNSMVPFMLRAMDPQQEKLIAATPPPKDAPTADEVAQFLEVTQSRKQALAWAQAFARQSIPDAPADDDKSMDHAMRVMALMYRYTFTAAEVKAEIAFYSSPAGKKLLDGASDLGAEMGKAMAPTTRKLTEKFKQKVTEYYQRQRVQQ